MGASEVYYDPYSPDIVTDPYPVYRRLREEVPLYYNRDYDFYALSRYQDVRRAFLDHETFSSSRGDILELIQQNMALPAGAFIFSDPPQHAMYRNIAQRMFSPRRMRELEPRVRELTIRVLEPLMERDEFDVIHDVGWQIPMQVIGMLLGIPEQDLQKVREITDARMRTEQGKPIDYGSSFTMEQSFGEYIDWRAKNPSHDVTTELLNVVFTDETGTDRHLTRDELITFFNILAGAGNETTNRLIGWTAKTLAEHPDQRRDLVANPDLIPAALEEVLRYEPPGPHVGRYVARDAEFHGRTVPAGSAILLLVASANRDERAFPDPERFDIHRERPAHTTFGYGIHTCIGNVLARLEGRVVFEEWLKRMPEWDVDLDNAALSSTSTVRGWETLPAYVNARGRDAIRARVAREAEARNAKSASAPASVDGEWQVSVQGPTGPMETSLKLATANGELTGSQTGEGTTTPVEAISYDPDTGRIAWTNKIKKPMKMTLKFSGTVEGDGISGQVKAGFAGTFPFSGHKAGS